MIQLKESMITKDLFARYVDIQRSNKYNMIMDAKKVISLLGCTEDEYKEIIRSYDEFSRQFNIKR